VSPVPPAQQPAAVAAPLPTGAEDPNAAPRIA
jgi:hypothetical protein